MKRTKKLIALLTAAALVFTMVSAASAAALKDSVTEKDYTLSVGSIAPIKYPQVSGIDSLNTKIAESVSKYQSKYSGAFDEVLFDSIAVSWEAKDAEDSDRYAQLDVTLKLVSGGAPETTAYYIDKEKKAELADEAAYNAAIKAEADEKAAAEAAAAADEEEEEEVPEEEEFVLTDEILAELVPLREYVTPLGLELVWNGELKAVEVLDGDTPLVALFIGEDAYIVGDEEIQLGVAPELIGDYTYVPVSFFISILGAGAVVEDGEIVGFAWAEE